LLFWNRIEQLPELFPVQTLVLNQLPGNARQFGPAVSKNGFRTAVQLIRYGANLRVNFFGSFLAVVALLSCEGRPQKSGILLHSVGQMPKPAAHPESCNHLPDEFRRPLQIVCSSSRGDTAVNQLFRRESPEHDRDLIL